MFQIYDQGSAFMCQYSYNQFILAQNLEQNLIDLIYSARPMLADIDMCNTTKGMYNAWNTHHNSRYICRTRSLRFGISMVYPL